MKIEILSPSPKTTIEVCSIIDFFKAKILEDKLGGNNDEYHSKFVVEADDRGINVLLSMESIIVNLLG
jgi:hypothetical protein